MKTTTIFHSYSGITRRIAGRIQSSLGGDLIEVKPRQPYSRISAYTMGCLRARGEEAEPVDPPAIDLEGTDLIVIGTPVWAWKATPATNGAINALKNCEGKRAIIFATCGSAAGETIPILKKALARKGVTVIGEHVFTRRDVNDEERVARIVSAIRDEGNPS